MNQISHIIYSLFHKEFIIHSILFYSYSIQADSNPEVTAASSTESSSDPDFNLKVLN